MSRRRNKRPPAQQQRRAGSTVITQERPQESRRVPGIRPGATNFRPVSDAVIQSMYQNMGPQANPDSMYAPGAPLRPMPGLTPQTGIRGWDYQVGHNIGRLPRSTEVYSFADLRAISQTYYGVQMCQQVWFDYISQLELEITPRKDLIGEDGDISMYADAIQSYKDFFAYPDREHDLHAWLQMLVKDQLDIDAVAIYPRKDRAGRLYSLDVIDAAMITPLVDDRGRKPLPPYPAYEQYVHGIPAALLTSDDLIYVKETERTDSVYGRSRVERIILNINVALRKQTKDLAHFTDGNLPPGFVTPSMDVQWSQEEIEAWEMQLNNLLAGNDELRARLKVLPRGFEYKAVMDNDDIHMELDQFILNITAACHGLTMAELAFVADVNRSTGDSQENVVYRRAMGPLMKRYARLFTMILQKYFNERRFVVSFKGYEEAEDLQSHATAYTTLTNAGILGLTDAAKLMKLPENPDAPYIGRVFFSKDGPIFLDDMASDVMRNAAIKAKLAGFDMAANPALQPGGALPEGGGTPPAGGVDVAGENAVEEAPPAVARLTARVEELLARLNRAESDRPEVLQKHTGIMVAFMPDPVVAEQLALPDGEPARDLHVTLCMLGDTRDFTGNPDALKEVIANFAYSASPVEGAISGIGRFNADEDAVTPIYASVSMHHLHHLREQLVHALELVGYEIDHSHPYQPHITLAYIPSDAPMPVNEVPPLPLSFDTVWLCIGDARYPFEFGELPGEEDDEDDQQEEEIGEPADRMLRATLPDDEAIERDWAAFDAKRVPKGRKPATAMTEQQQDALKAQVEAQMDQIQGQSTQSPAEKAEARQDRAEARAARKVAAAQARLARSEAQLQKALAKEEKAEARGKVQAARLALKLARIKYHTLLLHMRLQKKIAAAKAKAARMAAAAQKKAQVAVAKAAKSASKAAKAQAAAAKAQHRAALKLQGFVHSISAKATQYAAMSARPLSKHWTSADAEEAQTIASDFSSLMDMVSSHGSESDAQSLLNDLVQSISELQSQHGITPARSSALGALVAHIQSSLSRFVGADEDDWTGTEYSEEGSNSDDQGVQYEQEEQTGEQDTLQEEERRYTITELLHLLETTQAPREQTQTERVSPQENASDDYRRWRARAIDDIKAGRTFRGFTTTVIPEHTHIWISDELEQCGSVEEVKAVFARAKANDFHWQDNNDGVQKYLATLKAQGITTVTWKAYLGACPECALNDGQTVPLGSRFASGAYIVPGHNHCVCRWVDNVGRRYEWTGTDGEYRQLTETEQ